MNDFAKLTTAPAWREVLTDPCTEDWQTNWFLDGDTATVENTPDGMVLTAGPDVTDNGNSMVLWTRESFAGDIRIEYDYTRLDECERFVNILYIQAAGKGEAPYVKDIATWSQLRERPEMSRYFKSMDLLHISYAVNRHMSKASTCAPDATR